MDEQRFSKSSHFERLGLLPTTHKSMCLYGRTARSNPGLVVEIHVCLSKSCVLIILCVVTDEDREEAYN